MNRNSFLLLGLLLISFLLPVQLGLFGKLPDDAPAVQVSPSPSAPSATDGLGPSVDISYSVQDKCSWDSEIVVVNQHDFGRMDRAGHYSYMMADDSDFYIIGWYETATSTGDGFDNFYTLEVTIDSPYTELKECVYTLAVDGDAAVNDVDCYVDIFNETDYTRKDISGNYGAGWQNGSLTLGSSYVVDDKIHIKITLNVLESASTYCNEYYLSIDQLRFIYDDVTETRRSTYSVQGGTVLYTLDWTTWDYNVDTTLSVPSAWTFQDVNPDCAESSGTFSCLVPEDYTAIYTDTLLASANWADSWTDSFESGWSQWVETQAGAPASVASEYTIVLDGAASVKIVGDSSKGIELIGQGATYTDCWIIISCYVASGSAQILIRDGSGWTAQSITTTGKWVTYLFQVDDLADDPTYDRNIILRSATSPSTFYWDRVSILESSVSTGSTIKGTMRHFYPNGYTTANFYEFTYNCTTWFTTNTAKLTTSNGSWSIDTSTWSLASGTKTFYTCNAEDTDDYTSDSITYPWTDASLQFDVFSFHMDDWYVHLTVYTNRRDCTVTIIDYHDGANTTKFSAQPEGAYSYKFEEWGDHTVYITATYGSSSISLTKEYEARRDYPDTLPPSGVPQGLTLQSAFISLMVIMCLIGILALGFYQRNLGKNTYIVDGPGSPRQQQLGKDTTLHPPEGYSQRGAGANQRERYQAQRDIAKARRIARQKQARGDKRPLQEIIKAELRKMNKTYKQRLNN